MLFKSNPSRGMDLNTDVQMVSKLDSLKPSERLSCPTDNPSMDDWMDTDVQKSASLLWTNVYCF